MIKTGNFLVDTNSDALKLTRASEDRRLWISVISDVVIDYVTPRSEKCNLFATHVLAWHICFLAYSCNYVYVGLVCHMTSLTRKVHFRCASTVRLPKTHKVHI